MTQTPARAYILCSNPRSGTTLMCDMLAQTGVAGKPDSFFRQKSLRDWCDLWQIDGAPDVTDPGFSEIYFDAMRREGRGGSGCFGMRLMGPDLGVACDWLGRVFPGLADDRARFDAVFGPVRYIHLSRQDKLAEAVSYIRAEQTGLWHGRPDGSALEQIAPTLPDGYDAARITQRMVELQSYDTAWDRWFKAQGLSPLRLHYESLAEAPQATLAKVLDHLGLDAGLAAGVTPGVRKLSDSVNADWIARYRRSHPNA